MSDPAQDDDALIEDLLAEALRGCDRLLTPEELAALRDHLGDVLAATPEGKRLLRQIRPDPSVQRSANVLAPGAEAHESDASKKASSEG